MKFSQNEIESEISDVVPHGIRRQIAREAGIYESVVYGYFNPDDPRKSPMFETLLILSAMDNSDDPMLIEAGDALWQKLCILRQMSMPKRDGGCAKTEAVKFGQEAQDVAAATITNEPLYKQYVEAVQARDQAERLANSILALINDEKDSPNGTTTRFSGIRNFAQRAVNGRAVK